MHVQLYIAILCNIIYSTQGIVEQSVLIPEGGVCHILGDIRPCRRLLLLAAHMIKTNAAKKTIFGYLDISFDRCLDISIPYMDIRPCWR